MTDSELENLTEQIIGSGIRVHTALGPGLLESVYRECMFIELRSAGLNVVGERQIHLSYNGVPLGSHLRLDLLVESSVIVELKSMERIHPVSIAQVLTYVKLANCPAGLLMNFNVSSLRMGIRRVTHPNRYVPRRSGIDSPSRFS